ncbi:MAG TPA: hypothetical protein VF132_08345 [Rudaea sp.]
MKTPAAIARAAGSFRENQDRRRAVLRPEDFLAVDLRPVERRPPLLRAVDFFAADLRPVDLRPDDFFAVDFLLADFLPDDFFAADFLPAAFLPRAPPVSLLTVAQARAAAVLDETPRFL